VVPLALPEPFPGTRPPEEEPEPALNSPSVKTVILCGGRGTRAYPHTVEVPKPLLEVAGRPVVEHVMEIYASQGHTEFVLTAGFKHERIAAFAGNLPRSWDVEVVDTGQDTNTGARIAYCRRLLGETFFATYADGVGDVDLAELLDFHGSRPGSVTVTTVPLPSPYGTVECDTDGRVQGFVEKPRLPGHWINAGFFVIDQSAFQHWRGDDLERTVLPSLGVAGQLYAYRHRGFWKSMDTYKDALELSALCAVTDENPDGRPPWMRSAVPASS